MNNKAMLCAHQNYPTEQIFSAYKKIIDKVNVKKIDYPLKEIYLYLWIENVERGDTSKAFQYLHHYHDAMLEETKQIYNTEITNIKEKYENEKVKKDYEEVSGKLSESEIELRNEKVQNFRMLIFIIVSVILVAVIAILALRLNKSKNILRDKNKEKDTLLKEIHHRVKNNLQIISSLLELQTQKSDDQNTIDIMLEGQNRVKAMALIHKKLYQNDNLAQIKIWNTTRTAQEIADNMSNCVTTTNPNLLAAYNMIDGQGNVLTDESGNGNNGTFSGNSSLVTPTLPFSCYCELTLDQPRVVNVNQPSTGVDTQTACGSYTWIDGITYTTSNNTAKDTLVNMVGCDSIVTLNLTINNVDNGITNNGITLTADATGASYQWIDCDNNNAAITGETGQTFTPTSDGNYAVVVTENNCTDTSDCEAISGVGIENAILNQITMYPNPTEGQVQVALGSNVGSYNYSVISVDGKVISNEQNQTKNILRLDLTNNASGIYLLTIQTNSGNKTIRIVKN